MGQTDVPPEWLAFRPSPGVVVRDYGYPTTDRRHYGLPPAASDSASQSSQESSNLSQYSDIVDSTTLQRLFVPNDTSSGGSFHGCSNTTSNSNSNASAPASAAFYAARRSYKLLNCVDIEQYVLPHLSEQLRPHVGGMSVDFAKVRAMFDFQKVTAWEMNIVEHEEFYIASLRSPAVNAKETTNKDTKKTEQQDNTNSKEEGDKEKKKNEKEEGETKEGPITTTTTAASATEDAGKDSEERWATIDEDEDKKDTKSKSKKDKTNDDDDNDDEDDNNNNDEDSDNESSDSRESDKKSLEPEITFQIEPTPADFAAQLSQLLDYQGVYGDGWVTGIKLRIKGKLIKPKQTEREVASGIIGLDLEEKSKIAKIRVRMYNLGLVPGNYVEKY